MRLSAYLLAHARSDECLGLCVRQIQTNKVILATLAKEHIRLDDEARLIQPGMLFQQRNKVSVLSGLRNVDGQLHAEQTLHSSLQKTLSRVFADLLAGHRDV